MAQKKTTKVKELLFRFDATAGELAALVGPMDENIREIERAFTVNIIRRAESFYLSGKEATRALSVLEMCAARIQGGEELTANDVHMMTVGGKTKKVDLSIDEDVVLKTRKAGLRPRTPNQRSYLTAILKTDITFGVGPAGTGKTYLAVAAAVDAFERGTVERILLTRPAIEAGERLGFLPGDLTQKVDPYLRPLYDALFDLFGFEKTQRLMEKQLIEIAPIAYMRGRTLNNAFVILDEAQNTTREQMKMFLTRIGFGTKAVITGDVTQIDLPRGVKSGLKEAVEILFGVKGISITHFTRDDIVRHPLVASIVEAYEKFEAKDKGVNEKKENVKF